MSGPPALVGAERRACAFFLWSGVRFAPKVNEILATGNKTVPTGNKTPPTVNKIDATGNKNAPTGNITVQSRILFLCLEFFRSKNDFLA
jgi:hypothetical protein